MVNTIANVCMISSSNGRKKRIPPNVNAPLWIPPPFRADGVNISDLRLERWRRADWVDPVTKERVSVKIWYPVLKVFHPDMFMDYIVDHNRIVYTIPEEFYHGCYLKIRFHRE